VFPGFLKKAGYMGEYDMEYEIVNATEADREEVLSLYRSQIGREFCPWDEDYPSNETIDWDFERDALFVLKSEGKIKAAISVELDDAVEELTCWDKNLAPEGELARLAVIPEEQNKGYGRIMLQFGMEELKRRGFKGIHFLVNKYNTKAIRCYEVFGFNKVGECYLYDQDYICYEKEL
jgi:ribosomal protein S18 acetylase RimI-like enzyme